VTLRGFGRDIISSSLVALTLEQVLLGRFDDGACTRDVVDEKRFGNNAMHGCETFKTNDFFLVAFSNSELAVRLSDGNPLPVLVILCSCAGNVAATRISSDVERKVKVDRSNRHVIGERIAAAAVNST
jgi:hypothetical protein